MQMSLQNKLLFNWDHQYRHLSNTDTSFTGLLFQNRGLFIATVESRLCQIFQMCSHQTCLLVFQAMGWRNTSLFEINYRIRHNMWFWDELYKWIFPFWPHYAPGTVCISQYNCHSENKQSYKLGWVIIRLGYSTFNLCDMNIVICSNACFF